jgi:hypothetical protein
LLIFQQFIYCRLSIRCCGNVFWLPLPNNIHYFLSKAFLIDIYKCLLVETYVADGELIILWIKFETIYWLLRDSNRFVIRNSMFWDMTCSPLKF